MAYIGFDLMGENEANPSCTLQRMYHSVPDPVKHLLLIVKEHLLIAALQNVAPPSKRIYRNSR